MELYKNLIPIVRRDLNEGWIRGLPTDAPASGAVPRDYAVDPVEMRDSPDQMKLYAESEYDALYDAGEANEDSLEHLLLRAIVRGEFAFLDQNGFPDCWTHSVAHAVMVDCIKQNIPVPKLNAVACATMMGRTNGGWCGLGMKFIRDNGIPVAGTGSGEWPYQSRSGRDTPELRASMKRHRALEDWYDMGREVWDQDLTQRQFVTCLFNNLPTPSDYNRAAHSMLSLRRVRIERGSWGTLTLNSWSQFGYHGLCVLDSSWVPDGSCALRSSTPAS